MTSLKGQVTAGRLAAFPTDAVSKRRVPLPPHIAAIKGLAVYEVCGDSLESDDAQKSIYNGDCVITRPPASRDEICRNLCVVELHGSEKVVKHVECRNAEVLTLTSANAAYEPQFVHVDNANILAVVIGVYREF